MDRCVITDTQIISYYFKNAMAVPKEPIRISSVTAAEFLQIQSSQHNKANYYPILPTRFKHSGVLTGLAGYGAPIRALFDSRRHAAQGKRRTDQLILDFGPNIPTYIEFGSIAITQLINERHDQLYSASIAHLDKAVQKKLTARFRFLLDEGVFCVAMTPAVATVGLNLLGLFMDRYQAKENTRNTINDVLVLATAIKEKSRILTRDNLLVRFSAEVMTAPTKEEGDHLNIDFSLPLTSDRRNSLESKGFVNRGWKVLERRTRGW